MNVTLKEIQGTWDAGWIQDKHVLSSTYIGDNQWGHRQFDTQCSDVASGRQPNSAR